MNKKQKIQEIKRIRDKWNRNAYRIMAEAWEYHEEGRYANYHKFKRESDTIKQFVNDLNEVLDKHVRQPNF